MKLLSYDTKNPIESKRSFQEEWAPHARQTDTSFEWWYITGNLHDAQGNPYFLYIGAIDHNGAVMQKRMLGQVLPPNMRSVALTSTLSDYANEKIMSPSGAAILPDVAMFDDNKNQVLLDGKDLANNPYIVNWDYVGDEMNIFVDNTNFTLNLKVSNANDGVWHKDSLGIEGMIQQGTEEEFSFYYSLPNCPMTGKISFKDENGNITKTFEVFGRSWVDRQWGDFFNTYWEWSSFRFDNGATMHLYNFFNGHQEGFYRDENGNIQYFDNVLIKQNGYCKAPLAKTWNSWGWSYEFPIEIEGSKYYTVKPYSDQEFLQFPDMEVEFQGQILHGYALYEGLGKLINDKNGKVVGASVNESIDVRAMGNYPGGPNQH